MGLMQIPAFGATQVYIHHPPGRAVRTAARQEANANVDADAKHGHKHGHEHRHGHG